MSSLAAKLVNPKGPFDNVVPTKASGKAKTPPPWWDDAVVEFTKPPGRADDVRLTVYENIDFVQPTRVKKPVRQRRVGLFGGNIRQHKFEIDKNFSAKRLSDPWAQLLCVAGTRTAKDGVEYFWRELPPAQTVRQHQLWLTVEGKAPPRTSAATKWSGSHKLNIAYSLAMVTPSKNYTFVHDTALNHLVPWAIQWRDHDKQLRSVVGTTVYQTRQLTKIEPAHYDDVIRAIKEAADKAASGVVAVAVGHGERNSNDPNTGSYTWFNLVPEDKTPKRKGGTLDYKLRIRWDDVAPYQLSPDDQKKLGLVAHTPGYSQRVRLDALDRLGDALHEQRRGDELPKLRLLILQTCNVRLDPDFVQMLADRIRIPVAAQKRHVVYRFLTAQHDAAWYSQGARVIAGYAGEPDREVWLHYWPIYLLGDVKLPLGPRPTHPKGLTKPPHRWGV